uniref:F-box domain-containing protein n=1 Tax=Moniliophthora roreri TaxID=221103 RepID=A0A0W0G4Z9_MONRR
MSNFRCDLFSICPALTSVLYEPAGLLMIHCPLPWIQLRSLEVINAHTVRMVLMTLLCPKLKRLTVICCGGEAWPVDSVLIPGVMCLSIVTEDADKAYCAFKHLMLPQLSSLEISCTTGNFEREPEGAKWEEWDEQLIMDFFNHSAGCAMTSLLLRSMPILDEQLIQFLRFMPVLSSLTLKESANDKSIIVNWTITQQFLQRLTISHHNSSAPLLCKLTDIKPVLHNDGLVENVLPNALISRWIPDVQRSKIGIESIHSVYVFVLTEGREFAMTRKSVKVLVSKLRVLIHAGVRVRVALSIRGD